MTRWHAALLAAYAEIFAQAWRDMRRVWRQARLLRAVIHGKH